MTQPLFGIININKSRYVTSRAAVNVVQRAVKPTKVGHAGTLDPMATGVLLVCVGKATRLVSRIQDLPKVYRAKFVFGKTSDTDDAMGRVESTGSVAPTTDEIRELLPDFKGELQQIPPAFSAVHVNGRRAYEIARRGKSVELKPKTVRVDRIELIANDGAEFELEIECGSGTYIRSIARDMGERLGCGGLMSALERTSIGGFSVRDGIDVGGGATEFRTLDEPELRNSLQSPLTALPGVIEHVCSEEETRLVRLGHAVATNLLGQHEEVAMLNPNGRLIAIASPVSSGQQLKPRLVFDALQ